MERKLVRGVDEFEVAISKIISANLAFNQHPNVTFITLTLKYLIFPLKSLHCRIDYGIKFRLCNVDRGIRTIPVFNILIKRTQVISTALV